MTINGCCNFRSPFTFPRPRKTISNIVATKTFTRQTMMSNLKVTAPPCLFSLFSYTIPYQNCILPTICLDRN